MPTSSMVSLRKKETAMKASKMIAHRNLMRNKMIGKFRGFKLGMMLKHQYSCQADF